ncbi:hypothetical protein GZH47_03020 [Paenibacillus rhizovicinus]|uniref:Uncharacterized protein n=1 Tax=Paenibacillus rhizovicinus TaxID=2704463 RepID=A0A6C0NUP2_9BACL|nr:hypothetical protein [Paenibacillus rhizovicinus]QHW29905.1 hypothetical protein GZH47_03020 [Paenibacillus rhizovicinus]
MYDKIDITPKTDESLASNANEEDSFTTFAYNNPRINGDDSGAFIRQTSVKGYIGSKTQFTLPSNISGDFNITGSGAVAYIYNGLDYKVDTHPSDYLSMEGGIQVSQANNNFSSYIRVNGGSLILSDDAANPPGSIPPRYKAGTAFTSNLRYEIASGKLKYYSNGTNVNNVVQNLSFTYARSFTSTQLAEMRAKRVLAIGKDGYDGTQALGYISLNYAGSTLLKTDGSTNVNYSTGLLDSNLYNNKIYGTAYWPSSAATYSPPVSGDISTQSQTVDTN